LNLTVLMGQLVVPAVIWPATTLIVEPRRLMGLIS
jgi:hypothetical protein